MTFDFDVAIVGGGPAGTSTALNLVRREHIGARRVVVLEKGTHPRDKPCAGAVSTWGLDALAAIGVALDVPHAVMRGLRVLAGPAVGVHVGRLGVVVRRCEFDWSLWRQVVADGVAVHEGQAVTRIARIPGGWAIEAGARMLTARLVAACDGAGSSVRKLLGMPEAARKGHLYVAESPFASSDAGPKAGLCDFDLRVAESGIEGYYWDFPTVVDGAPSVSRGIYHANFTPRSDLKASFARALAARGLDIARLRLKPFSTRPLVSNSSFSLFGLALVGEAAGIDRTTGEGIAQAILTGAIAARHFARALRTGERSLEGYGRDVIRSRVGRHLLQSAWLARQVYGPCGRGWREFLARDTLAQQAGAAWYAGRPLGWPMKARLGILLGASVGARAFGPRV